MGIRPVTDFAIAVYEDFTKSSSTYVAAGIAYWTLCSLFPLMLAGAVLIGYLYPTPDHRVAIVESIVRLVPVSWTFLLSTLDGIIESRGALSWIAIVIPIWSGISMFSAVRSGINHTWHIENTGPFWRMLLIDLAMLVGAAVVVLLIVIFTAGTFSLFDSVPLPQWLAHSAILSKTAAFGITVGVVALLYRCVPNIYVAWRDV